MVPLEEDEDDMMLSFTKNFQFVNSVDFQVLESKKSILLVN